MTLMGILQAKQADKKAKRPFRLFLEDTADQYYMKKDFRTFYFKCLKIQDAVKWIEEVRQTRRTILEKSFDKERNHMTKYYYDKSKKNKKFKAI